MKEELPGKVLPSTPIDRLRLYAVFFFFAVGFVYVSLGLGMRQLVESGKLKEVSESQSRRIVILPPARGRIYDRNGEILVDNRARWSVKADLAALQKEFRTEYLKLLAAEKAREATQINREALQETAKKNVLEAWLSKVWFVIDETNKSVKAVQKPTKVPAITSPNDRHVDLEALRKHLRERRPLPFTLVPDLAFPGTGQAMSPQEGMKAVARFIEQFPVDGPIRLESDIIRTYPHGTLAAHVLGYVKDSAELPPNVDDLADTKMDSLQKLHYTGKKGAAGIEETQDELLRGNSGWELWTKTSAGYNQSRLQISEPRQGSSAKLSLDWRIQAAAESALSKIRDTQAAVLPAAAIMMDVNTGEILALASQPTFDPNRLADHVSYAYYDEIEKSGGWMNRSIQGLYAPGSTFKIITAVAGMRNKIIDWDDILECGPSFRVGNRDFPEHDPNGYGQVDVEKMLSISCNVWNYQVGVRTGVDNLSAEARRFGLNTPLLKTMGEVNGDLNKESTALPSPADRGLVVPDQVYKTRIGQGRWTDGDTANLAIGQGYLLTTPLHMACVAASVARAETRTTPYIIHDPKRDGIHQGSQPIGLTGPQMAAMRAGLESCVEGGTAKLGKIPGLPYAAKTGTAEYFKDGKKAHLAWMIGYAPADKPAVAFCVLVEGQLDTSTWGGKTAGPVAREMILAWADTLAKEAPKPVSEEPGR